MKLQPKHFYMALPVLLLGMSVCFQMTACVMASRGNGAEIERDYYDRALNWDDYQKTVAASRKLGWRVEIQTDRMQQRGGELGVTFVLLTKDGEPVEGATGLIRAFQNGRVDEMLELDPVAVGPGLYRATFHPRRTGLWVWRLRFERGDEVFVEETRTTLFAAEGLR